MRNLTLDEKISIKGRLATKGVVPGILARLNMKTAIDLYWRCFGTPAVYHSTPKMWRNKPFFRQRFSPARLTTA